MQYFFYKESSSCKISRNRHSDKHQFSSSKWAKVNFIAILLLIFNENLKNKPARPDKPALMVFNSLELLII